jgi:hypothetical protein
MFGREAAETLFIKGGSFSNLVEGLKETGGGFVFSTQSNPNFISLEHTVNIGKSFELTLSLIDPTSEFEKQFLTSNVLEVMANSYPNDGSRFFPKNWKGNESQRELSEVYNRNFEFLRNSNIEYLKNTKKRNIYLAYGIGDQLNQWAGPFKVYIQSIDVKIEGPRILTIKFVATENHLDPKENTNAFGIPAIIDNNGTTTVCTGNSELINLNYLPNIYDPLEIGYNPPIDLHVLIVDILRDYIRQATQHKNIIILLPDLNKICSKAIDLAKNLSRLDNSTTGSLGSLQGGDKIALAATLSPELEIRAKREQFLKTLLQDSLGLDFVNVPANNNRIITTGVPSNISTESSQIEKRSKDRIRESIRRDREYENQQNVSGIPIAPSRASVILRPDKVNQKDNLENYYKNNSFCARLYNSTDSGIPKHMDLINNLIKTINSIAGGIYTITHEVLSENNLLILDLWKSDTKLKCQTYRLFSGDYSIEESEEFIIFGDINLIREYLYASDIENILGKFLHPQDAEILLNPDYIDKIKKITAFNTTEITYPFGDQSYIPDEFAYFQDDPTTSGNESFGSLLSKKDHEIITKLKCPVFRYNTKNPNITELTIKESNQYWALLLRHFETVVSRKAAGIIGGIIPSEFSTLKPKTITELVLYATEAGIFNEGISVQRRSEIYSELRKLAESQDFDGQDTNDVMIAVFYMIEYLSQECNIGLRTLFKQQYATDPTLIINNFLNQVYNQVYQVNIQTLPMFNLSNVISLTRPCILLMQNVNMPMIRQPDPSILSIIYSGLYRIMGFRHNIDSNGCYSEFFLQKVISIKNSKTKDQTESMEILKESNTSSISTRFLTVKDPVKDPKFSTSRFLTVKDPNTSLQMSRDIRSSLLGISDRQRSTLPLFHPYYKPPPPPPPKFNPYADFDTSRGVDSRTPQ